MGERVAEIRIMADADTERLSDVARPRSRKKGRPHNIPFIALLRNTVLLFMAAMLLICFIVLRQSFALYRDQMERIGHNGYHTLVRSSPVIFPGLDLEKTGLLRYFDSNGYRRSNQQNVGHREYHLQGNVLLFRGEKGGNTIRVELANGEVVSLVDIGNGKPLPQYQLPKEVMTSFLWNIWERRRPLAYHEFPSVLVHAVLAVEDKNFFRHFGIDVIGIARAGIVNIRQGRVVQGGSTISQQLVKVLLQRRQRDWSAKFEEFVIAIISEMLYSKEEILSAYLNNVYLGQAGRFEIRGMAMAANLIIGKDLKSCNVNEYALLAGLIRSPNSASPTRNPLAAASRTRTVLKQMDDVDNYAVAKTIVENYHRSFSPLQRIKMSSYYFAMVEQELQRERLLPGPLSPPLQIELALDDSLQEAFVELMEEHLRALEKKKGLKRGVLQGAAVAMNAHDGAILAVIGGRSYLESPFNRASQAKRQIGSLMKPFAYLVGLGGTGFKAEFTQATMVSDTRIRVDYDGTSWSPRNFDGKYLGSITIRDAIAKSRNIPVVRLGLKSGLDRVADLVVELAINPAPVRRPSLLLGACESTPVDIAGAYAAIANGGNKIHPGLVTGVVANGMIIWQRPSPQPMLSAAGCYVMTDILRTTLSKGSASGADAPAGSRNLAGKTGTTSRLRDVWFAGYSPEVVMVVWIGRDDNQPVGFTGATGALPLWYKYMEIFQERVVPGRFTVPGGVRFAVIDPQNGHPVVGGADKGETMAFIAGTEPNTHFLSGLRQNIAGPAFKKSTLHR